MATASTENPSILMTFQSAINDDPDTDNVVPPFVEEQDSGRNNVQPSSITERGELGINGRNETKYNAKKAVRLLKKSSSDHSLVARSRSRRDSDDKSQIAFRVDDSEDTMNSGIGALASASSSSPQSNFRSTSSSPGIEMRSRYHDRSIDFVTLQQHLARQIGRTGQYPPTYGRIRHSQATNDHIRQSRPEAPKPSRVHSPVRSKSDSVSIPQASMGSNRQAKSLPLKSSMKRKSKSAAATPPNGKITHSSAPAESQHLRRVKTVEFETNPETKSLHWAPLEYQISHNMYDSDDGSDLDRIPGFETGVPRNQHVKRMLYCAGIDIKSRLAYPLVTRTDVHVISISPSWSTEHRTSEDGIDPSTSVQDAEPKIGRYEIIWNDAPTKNCDQLCQRDASPNPARAAVGPSVVEQGLERVNSKLTEWHGAKPQILMLPDNNHTTLLETRAVDDTGEFGVQVPPNSTRTSADPSQITSHATSTQHSRSTSSREPQFDTDAEERLTPGADIYTKFPIEVVPTLVVPDSEVLATTHTGEDRRTKYSEVRRLSNMEESDVRFRGHRDSLTLARSRIIHARDVSPELLIHSDTVSIAKKRMHARNQAISGLRNSLQRASDPLPAINNAAQLPTTYAINIGTPKIPNSSNSASVYDAQSPIIAQNDLVLG